MKITLNELRNIIVDEVQHALDEASSKSKRKKSYSFPPKTADAAAFFLVGFIDEYEKKRARGLGPNDTRNARDNIAFMIADLWEKFNYNNEQIKSIDPRASKFFRFARNM